MSVFLVVSGLFGCRSSQKHTVDDIISFHTFYYGMCTRIYMESKRISRR